MNIKHLIKIRKQYRHSNIQTTTELKKGFEDLNIGLIIAVGKLSYCKGQMTIYKKRIKQLEEEIKLLKVSR